MVSLDDFKQSLGSLGNKLSNEEIDQIRHVFDRIADIAFDRWLENKNENYTEVNLREYNDMNNEPKSPRTN